MNSAPCIRRWPTWLAVAVICLAILAAYHNCFRGPFVFDDETAVLDNPTIRQLWPVWKDLSPPRDMTVTGYQIISIRNGSVVPDKPPTRHFWPTWEVLAPPGGLTVSGRPLANLTLALNYAVSGTRTWSYHAFNLVVHVLAALALFGVVRRTLACARCRRLLEGDEGLKTAAPPPALKRGLSRAPVPAKRTGPDDFTFLALAITLLWALHPLQTEAVTYIVQRVESLMSLFFLLTLYCFIRSVEEPRPLLWQGCAVAACLLGAATKEVIALAPVLVLLYDRTFVAGSFAAAWRQRGLVHVALASTWIVVAVMISSTGWDRNGTSGFDIGVPPWAYWLTQFEAVARYLGLSFWPHPLVFEYGTFWVHGAAEVLPYAVVVVPLAAAALFALWRWPMAGFLGAWFFGILAPTSIMPGRIQMIVEHRLYLPVAALIVLAAVAVAARCGRCGIVALLAWAGALGCLTESRNAVYHSARSLWTDTAAQRPRNDRAHNNLGNALVDEGLVAEGIAQYRTALQLKPDYPEAHNNLGNALLKAGRVAEAMAECQAALELEPKYAKAHNNLGNALLAAGRIPEAVGHYQMSIQFRPGDPMPHYNLGNAWLKAGRIFDAIEEYKKALRLQPDNVEARYNYGNGLLIEGKAEEAIEQYNLALQLKPDYLDAHTNLGNALLQADRTDEAIAQFEMVLKARPEYAEGHNNLGAAFFRAGRRDDAIREFQTAIRLRPDYMDARGNLERARTGTAGRGGNPR